ncbi:MAG TPA: Hpt domain-containing protein [Anaerolineales bacterium]|nr:Hpt domain-containing protein [Anaerolineales bacterium]
MTTTQIDRATFEELKQVSGADFINELIDTFLEEAPKLIAQLKSAMKAGDAESFRRAAHSLKSNGATFGAGHLAEQARSLEMLGKESRLAEAGDGVKAVEAAWKLVADELKGLQA